jgi:hypothetical protein
MRLFTLLHRWLGVVFCLFFAMWFATGIIMHFVPFPALTEAERYVGSAPIDFVRVAEDPARAVAASGIAGVIRVRLVQRSDGPIYVVSSSAVMKALRAADLADGAVRLDRLALAIAKENARRRGLADANATVAGSARYDQWTVAARFDRHRPLYRIALNDNAGTELYVSSATGEIVQETTGRARVWNYVGSVAHWIYPTALRRHADVWTVTVWSLALVALVGAMAGAFLGIVQVGGSETRLLPPHHGWQAWHHRFGLVCAPFVLTFMFSGWLSMDSGLLFSTGQPTGHDAEIVAGTPDWGALPRDEPKRAGGQIREAEWFAFNGSIYRRERTGLSDQSMTRAAPPGGAAPQQRYLSAAELDALAPRLAPGCAAAAIVKRDDDYAFASNTPDAPAFRVPCGGVWFDIDGATGALLEKLDPSARIYYWLSDGLHTLDFPVLAAHPRLRAALVVTLCGCGFLFSLSGIILAVRRLRLCL